jgi:hypothetical protein
MGVISLGEDEIVRSLSRDRKVLSAEPFSILDPDMLLCPLSLTPAQGPS